MYILFEGIDTCGKSTQIALLAEMLPNAIVTHEPGGTEFGVKAREILLSGKLLSKKAEILLFVSDRAEHCESVIKPNTGKTIISDRGFVSGMAYAMANTNLSFDTLLELNRFALDDILPTHIVLFVTNKETLVSRLGAKVQDGIEARGGDYLMQVQSNMQLITHKLNIPFIEIDATANIADIHREIVEFITKKRGK